MGIVCQGNSVHVDIGDGARRICTVIASVVRCCARHWCTSYLLLSWVVLKIVGGASSDISIGLHLLGYTARMLRVLCLGPYKYNGRPGRRRKWRLDRRAVL